MTESRETGWYPLNGLEAGVSDWVAGVVLAAVLVVAFLYRLGTPHLEYDEYVNEIHEVRRTGDISRAEFERRVESTLTPDQQRIRKELLGIDGVDAETATKIARRFESIDDLRAAEADEIAASPGVSADTAARVSRAEHAEPDESDAESRTRVLE